MTDKSLSPILMWFRRDLRLTDNTALDAAVRSGRPVIPLFILDDDDAGEWSPGAASRWWLHGSLSELAADIASRGSRLVLRSGPAKDVIAAMVTETGACGVCWNRRYEPWAVRRDAEIKAALKSRGVDACSFNASLLAEPWTLMTQKGAPYRVFRPFWKAMRTAGEPDRPVSAPERIQGPAVFPGSDELAAWALRPANPDWAGGIRERWTPGEKGAQDRLADFTGPALSAYGETRNFPGTAGTSQLSPHLHFGEVGPRQIWHAVITASLAATGTAMPRGTETYLSEIAWREFSHHLLFHFPGLPAKPLRDEFSAFPWVNDPTDLTAWQRGLTGYPIVDAGMRELWATGWMHNRVRMIVASFLIKDLLIDWRMGEKWFWDTLVDADLASNAASWQWVAGCGADAAPYFRVFNPSLQGKKFDPRGDYVRRWLPELSRMPAELIHEPWAARPIDLSDAGVALGRDYPAPIIDHGWARNRALAHFKEIGGAG